ncbi:MAG: ABC transporter permease subunit [Verrucomicrobiota bacterium]
MKSLLIRLYTLSVLTVRELLRQNVLYLILIPALLTLLTLPLFANLTFEEQIKFMRDFCFGTMSVFGIFLAIIATAQSVANDIEQKTILTVLAKPMGRWEYLMGKGLGIGFVTFLALLILGLLSAGLFFLQEPKLFESAAANATQPLTPQDWQELHHQLWNPALLIAMGILYLKLLLVIGFTLLLSTVASSSLFTIFTSLMIYMIGHLQSTAREWATSVDSVSIGVKWAIRIAAVLLPDMSFYEGADRILLGTGASWMLWIQPLSYTLLNLAWMLGLATWLLESRDFR